MRNPLPGTDVEKEEIDEIHLLEAEKVLSADAETKLNDLHDKVKRAVGFFQKLEGEKDQFNKLIGQELATGKGDLIPTLLNLKTELIAPGAAFDIASQDVRQLIASAGRVADLMNDVSRKEGRFQINIRGRGTLKHWHNLNEAEKRQISRNLVSLGVVEQLLSSSRSSMIGVVTLIDMAMLSFGRAKEFATGPASSKALLLRMVSDFIKELTALKNRLEMLERTLNSARVFIERFKAYLNLEEKESAQAKAYVDYLLRIQSAGKAA